MAGLVNCTACLRRAVAAPRWQRSFTQASGAVKTIKTMIPEQQDTSSKGAVDAATATELIRNAVGNLSSEPDEKQLKQMQRNVRKQLQYMNDPWKIAKEVERMLEKDRYREALMLVEAISIYAGYVVSWNHLIDYQFKAGKGKAAVKLFNDMKKRGQHPNAQTYTILFNGFAHSNHPKLAVGEAFKHYNLLLQDRRLQPNATHMNALLFVCSKAGDIDSMFHVINTANDKARSPNAFTYTIILNALRHHALTGADDLAPAQKTANIATAVGRAKAIWSEVISGWTNGKTQIDEALVCAMGRILLQSPDKKDKLSVLDLIQQTMNIPNFTAKADKADLIRRFEPVKRKTLDDTALQSFEKPAAVTRASSHKGLFATPTQNTLSLILKTAATLNLTTAGLSYWHHIVDTLSVAPDTDCYLRLLGMLKVGRASSQAASFMPIIPRGDLNPRMYKIAMEACIRDNINDHVVPNARSILTSMLERLPTPDIHTLRLYLHTALVSHARFRNKVAKNTELKDEAKRDYALQITAAIDDLWEPYRALYNKYFKNLPSTAAVPGKILYNEQREVIALARAMFSAYNKVVSENMLSAEELAPLKPVGARINREIQAFYSIPDENADGDLPSFEAGRGKRGKNNEKSKTTPLILHQGGDFIWDTGKTTLEPENHKEREQGHRHAQRFESNREGGREFRRSDAHSGHRPNRGARRHEDRFNNSDNHRPDRQQGGQRFNDRRHQRDSYRQQQQ